jgi:hypothetical protein
MTIPAESVQMWAAEVTAYRDLIKRQQADIDRLRSLADSMGQDNIRVTQVCIQYLQALEKIWYVTSIEMLATMHGQRGDEAHAIASTALEKANSLKP